MRTAIAFLLLGISNNVTFCIVLAIAKDIENGGVGVVFLALQLPALLIKTTGPTWMHLFGYRTRTMVQASAASSGLVLIALSTMIVDDMKRLAVQLLGVSLCSVQNAVGEPSYLALSSICLNPARALAAWSTGTGLAGLLGFGWVMLLKMFNLSLMQVSLMSLVFPAQLLISFFFILPSQTHGYTSALTEDNPAPEEPSPATEAADADESFDESPIAVLIPSPQSNTEDDLLVSTSMSSDLTPAKFAPLDRMKFAMSLWKFMIPLFLVYLAEYNMQSGAWSAIGFPLDSEVARNQFYRTSNIMYQCGVFVSRSCGQFFTMSLFVLWLVPFLQFLLLGFFIVNALFEFWYNWSLLCMCFVAGLFGGTVYFHGFSLLSRTTDHGRKELAMSSVSMASDVGVTIADFTGILVQGCIYRFHGIPGATYQCAVTS